MDTLDAEVLSLTTPVDLSRRGFLATTLIAGFTLATGPVHAQSVITTDAGGLEAGRSGDARARRRAPPAYRRHAGHGPDHSRPCSVVQEIFGVHEHIKDICRRFAKVGYLAIAPESFAPAG